MMKYSQYSLDELKKEIPEFGYNYDDIIDYPEYVSIPIKEMHSENLFDDGTGKFDNSFFEMVIEDIELFNHLTAYKEEYPYCDVSIESVDAVVQGFDKHYVFIHIIINTGLIPTTSIPEHEQ